MVPSRSRMTDSAPVPAADPLSWAMEHWLLLAAGGALLAALFLAVVAVAWLLLRRKRPSPAAEEAIDERAIDVSELDAHPPDASGPQLEVYGTPVRVAVVVMAPPGRGGTVPLKKELPALVRSEERRVGPESRAAGGTKHKPSAL